MRFLLSTNVLLFWLISLFTTGIHADIHMVADRVVLNSPAVSSPLPYTRINFDQSFPTPPLVFVLPSNTNPDPASMRVINVTTSYFDIAVSETPGEDNNLPATQFDYLAIEAGVHTLGSIVIEAGLTSTTAFQDKFGGASWATQPLTAPFTAPPALLLELQSNNHDSFDGSSIANPWFETISRNQTATQFEFALERAETSAGAGQLPVSVTEQVAWVAMSASGNETLLDNSGNPVQLQSLRSTNSIRNNCIGVNFNSPFASVPTVVASQSSRNGGDGGWVLSCGNSLTQAQVKIQEDQTSDSDLNHTNEIVSLIASTSNFTVGQGASNVSFQLEMGTRLVTSVTSSTLNFTSVIFPEALSSIPNVFTLPTLQGSNPASLRIRNVTTMGFEVAQVEPDGSPGAHESMDIEYLAAIPGIHTLPNGTTLEVGTVLTSAFQSKGFSGDSYDTINFSSTFTSPIVLLDIQSINNEPNLDPSLSSVPWLETTANGITGSSANIALDRGKSSAGFATLLPEAIGYLVMESNLDTTLKATNNNEIRFKTIATGTVFQGVDDGPCSTVPFSGIGFTSSPLIMANKASHNGADGGWLRKCTTNTNSVQLVIDEDQSDGTNRRHGASEQGHILAVSEPFAWGPTLVEMDPPSIAVEQDPVNGSTNPKSLPGAWLRYTQRIRNNGRIEIDNSTVSFDIAIPTDSDLFVGDLLSGVPIAFRDIVSSGVSISFIGLSSTIDGISFSNDGGSSYTYTPTADADGFDANVTHIKLDFNGPFNSKDSLGAPREFEIGYRVRVK